MTNNILTIVKDKTPLDVFSDGEAISVLLDLIKEEAAKFEPDMSTDGGRKEIASRAYQVSKAKTTLDNLGKQLVSEWKAKAKTVDNQRKTIRDTLDDLRDGIRQPLTDWENAEKERVAEY